MGQKGWGLVPQTNNPALEFGSLGHKALQTYYGALRMGMSREDAVTHALRTLDDILPSEIGPDTIPSKTMEVSRSFVRGYDKFYWDDSSWNILAIEWQFSIPARTFYGPVLEEAHDILPGFDPDKLPVCRGTVDIIREEGDQLVVMDHKFQKNIDTGLPDIATFWRQPLNYCRAVEIVLGRMVRGYVHNQIRKPADSLKPKFDPVCQQFESADDFAERLSQEYLDFPDYSAAYPNRKKGYFLRSDEMEMVCSYTFLLEQLCLDWEMITMRERCGEIKPFHEPPPFLPRRDPKSTCKRWGGDCEYMDLCTFGWSPMTIQGLMEREEPHP